MKIRPSLLLAIIWLGILQLEPSKAAAEAAEDRPNILLILTDDQRWDAMGYAGNAIIQTPEMDALAREGAYFSHALATTPICAASRASILTGLYERSHRYTFQTGPIRPEFMAASYPKLLREAGYYTGFFGKYGVNDPGFGELFDVADNYDRNGRFPDRRGYFYKELNGETVHLTRYTGQQALDFLDQAPTDRPFCLSLSFSAPHAHDNSEEQYFWQETTDTLYRDIEIPGPDSAESAVFDALPPAVREGFNRVRWQWRFDTPEKYQRSVKGYYRMISGIDLELGRIREKLVERGLAENTVIILLGDNGYFLGERQLAGKWLMYDVSVRVPLVIYDPRAGGHREIDAMALNIDVPATILDLAGIDRPATWQGRSLLPAVSGSGPAPQREAVLIEHLWEFKNIPPSEGVRTSEWKYLRYINDRAIEELYHLGEDPRELRNLAQDPAFAGVLAEMRSRCDALVAEASHGALVGPPFGLTVETIRKPELTLIQDPQPDYGWLVPVEAGLQKGYQILVASSAEMLARNVGDVWDSGRVASSASVNVEHAGALLQPDTSYYWKVRIWDGGDYLTDYSEPQAFRTVSERSAVTTPNAFQWEEIAPVEMVVRGDGTQFIDFGRAAFGTLWLGYQPEAAEELTVRLGEKLVDGAIDRNPGGTIRVQEVKLTVEPGGGPYLLQWPQDRRNTSGAAILLPKEFGVVMPFRYCEIEGAGRPISEADVHQRALFHYFEDGHSYFTCSDERLNAIWEMCRYTMKMTSFAGIYIDGDRERIPYEGDAYINQLGHYAVDREYAIARRTIEHFMDHPTWPTEWLLHTSMMVAQDYWYTGNLELLEAYYDRLKAKTLIELAREDGLISVQSDKVDGEFMRRIGFSNPNERLRDLVDWPAGERDGHDMRPINTVVNSFFYHNMIVMEELAALIGRDAESQRFGEMGRRVRRAINEKLLDPERGIYLDGEGSTHSSLHSNMLPLAFGLVPAEHRESVTAFVKSRGMACSVYAAQFLMEALYQAGEEQYALDLMRSADERSWWNMLANGSTVAMEAWAMKYKPNSDWNHAWGAVPANIIPRYLWGIEPVEAGFGRVRIAPRMADLGHCAIQAQTPRGGIEARFERAENGLETYWITLPGNMAGELITPAGVVQPLNPGMNRIECDRR